MNGILNKEWILDILIASKWWWLVKDYIILLTVFLNLLDI